MPTTITKIEFDTPVNRSLQIEDYAYVSSVELVTSNTHGYDTNTTISDPVYVGRIVIVGNDYIIIDIPPADSGGAGSPTEGTDNTNQLNKQGIFINSAPHPISTDNPFQIDLDMLFRSLRITIVDSVPVYP